MLVVDASVALRWMFDLDRSDRAEHLLRSGERLIAPDLVLAEITNAAWKFSVVSGVAPDTVKLRVSAAPKEFEEFFPSLDLKDRALAIALQLRHPAYDCFYLALAERRDCQLVTADDRLVRRCSGTPFAKLVRTL
jgi:predicted nucleic acid-binding protein